MQGIILELPVDERINTRSRREVGDKCNVVDRYGEERYYGKIVVDAKERRAAIYFSESGTSIWAVPLELVSKIKELEARLEELKDQADATERQRELNKEIDKKLSEMYLKLREKMKELGEKEENPESSLTCERHDRTISVSELKDLKAVGFDVDGIIKLREAGLV